MLVVKNKFIAINQEIQKSQEPVLPGFSFAHRQLLHEAGEVSSVVLPKKESLDLRTIEFIVQNCKDNFAISLKYTSREYLELLA